MILPIGFNESIRTKRITYADSVSYCFVKWTNKKALYLTVSNIIGEKRISEDQANQIWDIKGIKLDFEYDLDE